MSTNIHNFLQMSESVWVRLAHLREEEVASNAIFVRLCYKPPHSSQRPILAFSPRRSAREADIINFDEMDYEPVFHRKQSE